MGDEGRKGTMRGEGDGHPRKEDVKCVGVGEYKEEGGREGGRSSLYSLASYPLPSFTYQRL